MMKWFANFMDRASWWQTIAVFVAVGVVLIGIPLGAVATLVISGYGVIVMEVALVAVLTILCALGGAVITISILESLDP